MSIDVKHNLLKNFLSDQKLGQKNVQTSLDQSMMATQQKSLEMDHRNEGYKNNDPKNKNKNQKHIFFPIFFSLSN